MKFSTLISRNNIHENSNSKASVAKCCAAKSVRQNVVRQNPYRKWKFSTGFSCVSSSVELSLLLLENCNYTRSRTTQFYLMEMPSCREFSMQDLYLLAESHEKWFGCFSSNRRLITSLMVIRQVFLIRLFLSRLFHNIFLRNTPHILCPTLFNAFSLIQAVHSLPDCSRRVCYLSKIMINRK